MSEYERTNYEHGYIVGRAKSGALWLEIWEHIEYSDGYCIYDTFPSKFNRVTGNVARAELLQAGMNLKPGETIKLIYAGHGHYIPTAKVESPAPRKPYTQPTIRQMITVPLAPVGSFVTAWEFRQMVAEWYLPDLENLYELLCMAKHAKVSTEVMIGFVTAEIARHLPKRGVRS